MEKKDSPLKSVFAGLVIVICLVVAHLLFHLVMGDKSNFDADGHPLPGNYLGIIYKGGFIVPILMSFLLIVITVSIERFFTISKATGTGSVEGFVRKIQGFLASDNINSALAECDKQKGSVGNVVKATLLKYRDVKVEQGMDKEQKNSCYPENCRRNYFLRITFIGKEFNYSFYVGISSNTCCTSWYSIRYDSCVCRYGTSRCT
jgi:biopolymer transport protein ExbB